MFWKRVFIYIWIMASIVSAADDTTTATTSSTSTTSTTSTTSQTLVWITVTSSGTTLTIESAYVQTFASVFVSAVSPKSGSIGLGTLDTSGLGSIRTYDWLTVSAAAPPSQQLRIPGHDVSLRSIRIITLATFTLVTSLVFL